MTLLIRCPKCKRENYLKILTGSYLGSVAGIIAIFIFSAGPFGSAAIFEALRTGFLIPLSFGLPMLLGGSLGAWAVTR